MNNSFIQRTQNTRFMLMLAAASLSGSVAYGNGGGSNSLTPLTNLVVCAGENATFSTVASGPKPYRFEWRKDGVLLSNRTNSFLTITNVSQSSTGTYSVKLTGGANTVTKSATLSLKTPVSATPLISLVRAVGGTAVFSTVASGTAPFTYSWKKDGVLIPGKTQSSLTLTNLQTTNSGTYTVIVNGA